MSHGNGPDGKSWERGHGRSSEASEASEASDTQRFWRSRGAECCAFFCEVGTGLRKKEGGGAAGRDVVLLKYFSPERSAVLGGKLRRQIKKFD